MGICFCTNIMCVCMRILARQVCQIFQKGSTSKCCFLPITACKAHSKLPASQLTARAACNNCGLAAVHCRPFFVTSGHLVNEPSKQVHTLGSCNFCQTLVYEALDLFRTLKTDASTRNHDGGRTISVFAWNTPLFKSATLVLFHGVSPFCFYDMMKW